ncbi:MAG: respiratory nitrate reductase subunit gamma [Myxococcota bacterium]|nr:respiratory nitrate reductase subunit gamma [Myxococcota bacterium]
MHIIPYLVAYVAIAIFVVAVIARVVMWTKMPMHVRWELYPVAHEAKRAHYGGSYLEESEWWTKPREVSLFGELKVMIPEILFLVALKEHNPKLWARSFPFHFGLYLTIGCTVLMLGTGLLGAVAPEALAGGFGTLLTSATVACGYAGLILALFGALGLLQRRLSDPALKDFTSGADIFNLVFFVLAFGLSLATVFLVDPGFTQISAFTASLVTFNMAALPGTGIESLLPTLSVIAMSLLIIYVPMTHMSHFIGKYFAYHAIRWNDTPNLKGGPQEAAIGEVLSQKISWSASHIQGGGKKTWVDAALEEQKK